MKKILVFVVLFFTLSCFCEDFSHIEKYGMEYSFQSFDQPRPIRIHILKIDFSKNLVEPEVVVAKDPDGDGQAEAELTNPLKLADDKNIVAFINANPWDSFPDEHGKKNRKWYETQHVDIKGLVANNGKIITPPDCCVSVWTDKTGRFIFSKEPDKKEIDEGICGFYFIVKEGNIVPKPSEILNPLTAIGKDKTGYIVWLVVVDGRQKGFSEGMSHYELAQFMLKLGCYEVALMDGGGSSIMAIKDKNDCLQIVNSPSDRFLGLFKKIRPLPSILAIKKK